MRNNLIGTTGNTVHLPVNTFGQDRYACRPNSRQLMAEFVMTSRTDSAVTCKSCLKVIERAEALAHAWLDAITAGMAEAEVHHTNDVAAFESGQRDRLLSYFHGTITRARLAEIRFGQIGYWFRRGDVDAMNSAAWAYRRLVLETAYLAQLAAQDFDAATIEQQERVEADRAERVHETLETINEGLHRARRTAAVGEKWQAMLDLEHGFALQLATAAGVHIVNEGEWTERQRRLERVAEGQRQAAAGRQDGERPLYPVDARDWLASSLSMLSIHERAAEHQQKLAKLLDTPGELDSMDFWDLGMAAFDRQRNLDIIHARVIGQCPGCYRESVTQKFGHRASCPMYLMDGPLEMDTDDVREYWEQHSHGWSDEEVQRYWATVDPTR
jgi:hypothetical protein